MKLSKIKYSQKDKMELTPLLFSKNAIIENSDECE